jgi:predicted ATPase/DNA-binding SARP family transcriptional activator
MLPGEPSGVVFCVLGPLRVEGPHREVRIGGVRRRGVLLRLLASPGRPVPVDVLAEDVWDGDPPSAAASTLQSHVSALRQAIGPDRLIFANGGYQLRVGAGELDSLVFEADVAVGRAAISAGDFESAADVLDRALAWWRGPAFADVSGASWSVLAAGHLEETRKIVVEEALEAHLSLGHHDEVCVLAEQAVAAEPLRERRWAALMLALYRAGRQADALAAYQRLRSTLADQLGLDPSPQLSRLEHDILIQSPGLPRVGATPGSAAERPAVPAQVPASRSNLPAPVASFIGRKTELIELGKLVERYRLVTIVGTGGAGKTRLAIAVAAARLEEYRDGVWFIDLAELSDPAGVPHAVADAIGVRQVSGQPVNQLLADHVAGMQALLVVDNCEHLVSPAAATVEHILEAGRRVRVLATSRQPLRIPGEAVWQTPPIAFPADPDLRDPTELASFDAIRLFMERAARVTAAGDVTPGEMRVIADITARLEGIPLAIELAAARAAQLDLDHLASVLHDQLGLSWLGSRTAHARQQTLAATIGWSYDLLTPPLQSDLKQLSVFSGGFTLEAASAVSDAVGNVTDTVTSLAERSLIVTDRSAGQPGKTAIRYRMLESIRQYCAERITDENGSGSQRGARDAHSRFFADLARQASGALTGWHQGQWLTTLEADHANLVAAITSLLDRPSQAGEALQMIVHLDRFWHNRGHLAECDTLLQRGLDAAGQEVSTALRCAALNLAGQAIVGHNAQTAHSYHTQSLQIARSSHDDFHVARALWGLANVGYYAGDREGGNRAGTAAVDLARTVGDPVLLGECLVALGLVGDPPERKAIYQEALVVTRRSGDRIWTGWSHNNLGDALLIEGDLEAARQHLEQARAILDEVGYPSPQPVANLGWVHLRTGNLDAANAAFTEALHDSELVHLRLVASVAILGLACTAAAQRNWEQAACLLGFADGELQGYSESWPALERTYREQSLTDMERQLGSEFDRCYDSGRTGDRGDLIDYVLSQQRVL